MRPHSLGLLFGLLAVSAVSARADGPQPQVPPVATMPAEAVTSEPAQEAETPVPTPRPSSLTLPLKRVTVNGAELTYVELGSGEPVVLVHGAISDFRAWSAQLEPFSRRFRVVAYSMRYHRPNRGGGDGLDYSYQLHAADLVGFINALGLSQVNLVGHSYGADVALLAARQRPEKVKSLVLAEPLPLASLFAGTPEEAAIVETESRAFQAIRSALGVNDQKRAIRLALEATYGAAGVERVPATPRSYFDDNATALTYRAIAIPQPLRLDCADLKKLGMPVLLTDGELSLPERRAMHDVLQGCLPNTERATVMGAGHGLPLERPDEWNAAVLAFLERQRSTQPVAVVATPTPTPGITSMTVNGVPLTVRDIGSGEPVILVHDQLGDYRVWAEIASALSARHRVISYSRRHHYPGHASGVTEDSLPQHQRDLRVLIETLGLGPVHLVGHGDGGAIAALVAQSSPELVRSLVLVEPLLKRAPPAGSAAAREVSFRSAELNTALEAGWRRGGEALAVRAYVDAMSGEGAYEKLPADVKARLLDNALTLKMKAAAPADFSCVDAGRLSLPVLLVRSEKSPRLYQAIMDALDACWTGAKKLTLAGTTHRAPFEAGPALAGAILAFIEKK